MSDPGDVTALLRRVHAGEDGASDRLAELIYGELRNMARQKMRGERPDHTLSPTALANEVWLRLLGSQSVMNDRTHFFATAATAMRRVLVDHARSRTAAKRTSGGVKLSIDDVQIAAPGQDHQLLALDEALDRLAEVDPRAARVVELRFFSGLTHTDISAILKVERRTVDRDWAMARAWLTAEIGAAGDHPDPRSPSTR